MRVLCAPNPVQFDEARGTASLKAVPFSKSTQFGVEGALFICGVSHRDSTGGGGGVPRADVCELVSMLRDMAPDALPRCSRLNAMYASRACRGAVMVGMPMEPEKMSRVSLGERARSFY